MWGRGSNKKKIFLDVRSVLKRHDCCRGFDQPSNPLGYNGFYKYGLACHVVTLAIGLQQYHNPPGHSQAQTPTWLSVVLLSLSIFCIPTNLTKQNIKKKNLINVRK